MPCRLIDPHPDHEAWKRRALARRRTEHAVCIAALVIFILVGIWAMALHL